MTPTSSPAAGQSAARPSRRISFSAPFSPAPTAPTAPSFTLIELMLTLVIVALAISIVTLNIDHWIPSARAEADARQLAAHLRHACQLAAQTGTTFVVRLDLDDRKYRMLQLAEPAGAAGPDAQVGPGQQHEAFGRYALSASTTSCRVLFDTHTAQTAGWVELATSGGGWSRPAWIELDGEAGRWTIETNQLTGAVHQLRGPALPHLPALVAAEF